MFEGFHVIIHILVTYRKAFQDIYLLTRRNLIINIDIGLTYSAASSILVPITCNKANRRSCTHKTFTNLLYP